MAADLSPRRRDRVCPSRPEWPDTEFRLYGPGPDSGTFDYFTHAINGKEKASRSDYTASEDDNTLVQGIAGDVNALGYFGFAYYGANSDRVKLVAIDGGAGPVLPSTATINNGTYTPLARPTFIYVSTRSAERPEVQAFVHFYLDNAAELAAEVGYVALPPHIYKAAAKRFDDRVTGSVLLGRHDAIGMSIDEMMALEN